MVWWKQRKKERQHSRFDYSESAGASELEAESESVLFKSIVAAHGPNPDFIVPWLTRAQNLGAKRVSNERGITLLQSAWGHQGPNQPFNRHELAALGVYFDYFSLGPDREVVQQDEYGDYMLIQLTGTLAVERLGPAGEAIRMAETSVGDLIGEMSLLDQGLRFSSCVSLTTCDLAILTREGLEAMVKGQPQLATRLVLLLARKLSVRLRAVSAKIRA